MCSGLVRRRWLCWVSRFPQWACLHVCFFNLSIDYEHDNREEEYINLRYLSPEVWIKSTLSLIVIEKRCTLVFCLLIIHREISSYGASFRIPLALVQAHQAPSCCLRNENTGIKYKLHYSYMVFVSFFNIKWTSVYLNIIYKMNTFPYLFGG